MEKGADLVVFGDSVQQYIASVYASLVPGFLGIKWSVGFGGFFGQEKLKSLD